MTSRGIVRRVFAAVTGLWLTVAMVEPAGLHACPMHDALHGGHGGGVVQTIDAGERTATETAPSANVAHHAQHEHSHGTAVQVVAAHSDGESDDAREVAAGCLCLGTCCAATVVAIPDVGTSDVVVVEVASTAPSVASVSAPRSTGGVVLPFANGPPTQL
jgi:hypothetical protein